MASGETYFWTACTGAIDTPTLVSWGNHLKDFRDGSSTPGPTSTNASSERTRIFRFFVIFNNEPLRLLFTNRNISKETEHQKN